MRLRRVVYWSAAMAKIEQDCLAEYELKNVKEINRTESRAGSYGYVFEVKVKKEVFIAKKPHTIFLTESTPEERNRVAAKFREECILLSQLQHPNIVKFIGVYYGDVKKTDLTLVMEKLHCDLVQFLADNSKPDLLLKLLILKDVARGLVYLHKHSPPVIHRDLTAMNVLLTESHQAKIADVGVAKLMDKRAMMMSHHTRVPGQMYYMPPETLFEKPLCTPKLDIFSFGHLTLHLIIGGFPEVFDIPHSKKREGKVEMQKRKRSLEAMGRDHCLFKLTKTCLRDDLKKRPSARDLVKYMEGKFWKGGRRGGEGGLNYSLFGKIYVCVVCTCVCICGCMICACVACVWVWVWKGKWGGLESTIVVIVAWS